MATINTAGRCAPAAPTPQQHLARILRGRQWWAGLVSVGDGAMPSQYGYWTIRGWGQAPRLLLELVGEDYIDDRVDLVRARRVMHYFQMHFTHANGHNTCTTPYKSMDVTSGRFAKRETIPDYIRRVNHISPLSETFNSAQNS